MAHSEGRYVINFLWDMRKFYDSIKARLLLPGSPARDFGLGLDDTQITDLSPSRQRIQRHHCLNWSKLWGMWFLDRSAKTHRRSVTIVPHTVVSRRSKAVKEGQAGPYPVWHIYALGKQQSLGKLIVVTSGTKVFRSVWGHQPPIWGSKPRREK